VGCMPNFCHLDFDPAGVPHPAGILSTAEVLRCLEAESNWHMEQTTLQRRLSFTKSFRDRWAQRKLESEERFVELLRGSAGQATDRKDYLSRGVQSFGDRELGPQRTHTGASIYVSMWPLSALGFGTRDSGVEERNPACVAAEAAPASGGARGGGPAVQLGGPHVHGQASGPLREPLLAARGRSGLRWPRHCHRRDFSLPERRPCGGRRSRPGRVGGPDEGQLGGVRAAGPADRAGLEGCFSRCWARQNAVQLRAREHGWSASK
ncbi:unnamed protein product, partial [Prorocentrum cordatum]